MRILLQRVQRAVVRVGGESVAQIGRGLLLFTAIGHGDGEPEVAWTAIKVAGLRVFPDAEGRMNRSLLEIGGGALVVSQFTLYGDCSKGRRPSYTGAASGEEAKKWVDRFKERLLAAGVEEVATGVFGAMMDIELVNEGPVTLWIERESRRG